MEYFGVIYIHRVINLFWQNHDGSFYHKVLVKSIEFLFG